MRKTYTKTLLALLLMGGLILGGCSKSIQEIDCRKQIDDAPDTIGGNQDTSCVSQVYNQSIQMMKQMSPEERARVYGLVPPAHFSEKRKILYRELVGECVHKMETNLGFSNMIGAICSPSNDVGWVIQCYGAENIPNFTSGGWEGIEKGRYTATARLGFRRLCELVDEYNQV